MKLFMPCTAVAFQVFLAAAVYVNQNVTQPYMDEIFHYPQTKAYCQGRFNDWDPKITTFPGLYFVGMAYAQMLGAFDTFMGDSHDRQVKNDVCELGVLRSINVLQALLCSTLLYQLLRTLHKSTPPAKALLWAAVLSLYPLHFFFVPLYYTDVGSLTWLLLAYLLLTSML